MAQLRPEPVTSETSRLHSKWVNERKRLLTPSDEFGRKIRKATSIGSPISVPHRRQFMDWALHQPEVRFDVRAERAEYERLFRHSARVLQDRLARLGGGDRTKEIPVAEWERLYQKEAHARRLLYQARVLGWGKEKRYYFAHKQS